MTKNKPNKGLLKRVRITGNGRIKLRRAGNRHLRSHKTARAIRSYRRAEFVADVDMPKLRRMLQLKRPKRRHTEADRVVAADPLGSTVRIVQTDRSQTSFPADER